MALKKSLYLEEDVCEALKASAEQNRRSVTKQLDVLLREALFGPSIVRSMSGVGYDLGKRSYSPDPKTKDSSKKLRRA